MPIGRSGHQLFVAYTDEELAQAARVKFGLSLGMFAISLLVSILSAAIAFRLIVSRPIKDLLAAITRRRETGEAAFVDKTYSHDLGRVIDAFNEMTRRDQVQQKELSDANSQLVGQRDELRRWANELELRVAERTEELQVAKQAAEAADEAKSRFLWVMGHELRTPLNAVIGFSDLISMETLGPIENDEYKEYIRSINSSGQRLSKMVNTILSFAEADVPAAERVEEDTNLVGVLNDCLDEAEEMAEQADVSVSFGEADPSISIKLCQPKLKMAIQLLLDNAIKFNQPGGTVALTCNWSGSDAVLIEIADTGIGMSPGEVNEAMKPFRQIDQSLARNYEGAGLGLTVALHHIEQLGGTLSLTSEPGAGTTAQIALPATLQSETGEPKAAQGLAV